MLHLSTNRSNLLRLLFARGARNVRTPVAMFKKKPNIKALSPLRSSDRRRTADKIIKDLSITLPAATITEGTDEQKEATARTQLRNTLLPESTQSARFTTTQGPDSRPVSGTVYTCDYDGLSRVLWISIENTFYPTVYTLWKIPGIIPLIHCGSNVISRLQDGADLMIPGLIYGPPFPAGANKGAVVAVAGHDRLSVPIVVGRCVVDVAELKETRGVKGVAIETVHWEGDWVHVWGGPTKEVPEAIEGWASTALAAQVQALDLEDGEGEEDEPAAGFRQTTASAKQNSNFDDLRQASPEPERNYSTAEVDEIFFNAFLYGLAHHKSLYSAEKNHGLPPSITQTILMSTLVQPFLPTFSSHDTQQLSIKKTTHKTVRKFAKSLDKKGVVKSKDMKDEVVIVEVCWEDSALLSFKPYRLPKKKVASSDDANGADVEDGGSDPSVGQRLEVLQLFKPKAALSPLLPPEQRKDFYTSAELKTAVTAYSESQNLVSQTNKRIVKLDPFLANSVFDSSDSKAPGKNSWVDKEAIARGQVPRDILAQRVLDACSPFHIVRRKGSDDTRSSAKPKAGLPPKVIITLETRSGNKTATKVHGLETYGIAPQPLADELRKSCAGSTSVERLQGSSPKNPMMEVMIQGPQADAVKKALARRGVEERWIEVVDKTKGKGKR